MMAERRVNQGRDRNLPRLPQSHALVNLPTHRARGRMGELLRAIQVRDGLLDRRNASYRWREVLIRHSLERTSQSANAGAGIQTGLRFALLWAMTHHQFGVIGNVQRIALRSF